ncbi:MAG TPA: M20 family peptidase, partial [Dongiaceae bacterium]
MTANGSASERHILDWLASQRGAMLALLETLVNTDGGSYDKAGVDAVGAHLRAFLDSHDIPSDVTPDTKFGDAISATVGPSGGPL